jgi:hypothetical protein
VKYLKFSILIFIPLLSYAQNISPYFSAITDIKEGQIDFGIELKSEDAIQNFFLVRPIIKMPLPAKSENQSQLDHFASTWKGSLAFQYERTNKITFDSPIKKHIIGGQFEFGSAEFKYYPRGTKDSEKKIRNNSYAFELKYIGFYKKDTNETGSFFSPQFRIRYSHDWTEGNKVGVVNPPNNNGVITITNVILDAPTTQPTFSPAFSLQIYPGKYNLSYSPTLYYNFTGNNNPFDNLQRLRLECWIFYYRLASNLKIGITPFASIRTAGSDHFNTVEYGGMIAFKFNTSFMQFF